MTPKQKSEELIKKYISTYKKWNIEYVNVKTIQELKEELFQLEWFIPKECALIAVDELLNISLPSSEYGGVITDATIEYWQEVKQEIEKL